MGKFNTRDNRAAARQGSSPITTTQVAVGRGHNKALGYGYGNKSALFLKGVSSFFGEDKFYTTGDAEVAEYIKLVHTVAVEDPAWLLSFVKWLRTEGNIRTGAIVAGLEGAYALLQSGYRSPAGEEVGLVRQLVSAGIARGDEPGEALAYWASRYGKTTRKDGGRVSAPHLPKPVKRGLADAANRVVNEYNSAKWDTASKGYRLADVLNLVHAKPNAKWRNDLFGYLVANRYGATPAPESLKMLTLRAELLALPKEKRRAMLDHPEQLKSAGLTWEALAGWLQGPMDAKAWEAIIPNMGYFALLRNLRNFDQANVSTTAKWAVANRLADPEQVAKSKLFPFRFQTAFREAPSLVWGPALAAALDLSLANIPQLPGRTLVLVDTSGSMNAVFSKDGSVKRWDAASLFGIALAKRSAGVDLYSYSSNHVYYGNGYASETMRFNPTRGAETLAELKTWASGGFNIGRGTPTAHALRSTFAGHDRVIVLTDGQADSDPHGISVTSSIPADVPMYTFNLVGYKMSAYPSGPFRHEFGGLTDQAFSIIGQIEAGQSGRWPWELEA